MLNLKIKKIILNKWIIYTCVIMLISFIVFNLFLLKNHDKKNEVEINKSDIVDVVKMKTKDTVLIPGKVVSKNLVNYYPSNEKGEIMEFFVKKDQEVNKGTQLFSYDSKEVDNEIQQLNLDLKMISLKSTQNQRKTNFLYKEFENAKREKMNKKALNTISEQIEEQAISQESLVLEQKKTEMQLETALNKKQKMIVYSDISGKIKSIDTKNSRGLEENTLNDVSPKPFLQIISDEPYEIEGSLTELQKPQIQAGQDFTVTAKANSKGKWTGEIIEVEEYPVDADESSIETIPDVSPNMSHYVFRAKLKEQKGLSPGYHVSLIVTVDERKIITIPESSILKENNQAFVYILESDNKAKRKKVDIGSSEGKWVEILNGVTMGQKIIDKPLKDFSESVELNYHD